MQDLIVRATGAKTPSLTSDNQIGDAGESHGGLHGFAHGPVHHRAPAVSLRWQQLTSGKIWGLRPVFTGVSHHGAG
jgi:hypothetical protein